MRPSAGLQKEVVLSEPPDAFSKLADCEGKLVYLADSLRTLSRTEEVAGGWGCRFVPCTFGADRPLCPAGEHKAEGYSGVLNSEGEAEHADQL